MRLTKRTNDGFNLICNNCSMKGKCSNSLDYFDCVQVLAERLADYEDAEEQGRLVILPCKVGDTVYKLWYEPCHFGNAHPDGIDCDGCEDTCDIKQAVVECKATNIEWIIHNMMCKQPFAYTNREEAEAALKGETKDV